MPTLLFDIKLLSLYAHASHLASPTSEFLAASFVPITFIPRNRRDKNPEQPQNFFDGAKT